MAWRIPFVDLGPMVREVSALALDDFREILETHRFIQGPYVERFEEVLGEQLGARHAVACANGSDALTLALAAVGVTAGMKVAIPNATFWATYEAIAHLGAVPVLVDIDRDDLQMDFDSFCAAYDDFRFEAALTAHLFGWASAKLSALRRFCKDKGILLVEDAAQAYGVKVDGRSLFADATAATLSFFPAKVIGGAMDGGAVLVQDGAIADKLRRLRNHGRVAHYAHQAPGWNCRMADLQGAYLLRMCAIAHRILDERRRSARFYREFFAPHRELLQVHGGGPSTDENGYLNVITLAKHDPATVVAAMDHAGIGCARTYPTTLDAQIPAEKALRAASLTQSAAFCARVINLPLYFGMPDSHRVQVATELARLVHSKP